MEKAVQSTEVWREIDRLITVPNGVLEKIYATLRANDSEVLGTPDIYYIFLAGLADIQTNEWELPDGSTLKFSATEREHGLNACKKRWYLLYNRLHALSFVLNPYLHAKHKLYGLCMQEARDYIEARD